MNNRVKFVIDDIPSVNKVWRSLSKEDRIHLCGGNVPAVKDKYLNDPEGDFAKKFIYDDFGFILTLLIDSEPAGFVDVMRAWDGKKYITKSEISMAIVPKWRGRGFGKKLVSQAMSMVKDNSDYKTIEWYATEDNIASNKLAESNGFKFKKTFVGRDGHTKLNMWIYTQ